MKDLPKSCVSLILSRSLNYYKHSPYFAQLIDEYDKHASVVVPYQNMPMPGSDLILQLDNHVCPIRCAVIGGDDDGYVFTLSNQLSAFNMSDARHSGFVKLCDKHVDRVEPYFLLLVYSTQQFESAAVMMKDLNGGYVVASRRELIASSFNGSTYCCKRFDQPNAPSISDIHLVSTKHVAVIFERCDFFHVYNMFTSELAIVYKDNSYNKKLANKKQNRFIKYTACNRLKKLINVPTLYIDEVLMCLVWSTNDIVFLRFADDETPSLEGNNKKDICMIDMFRLQPPGCDVVACSFVVRVDRAGLTICLISLYDGSLMFIVPHDLGPKMFFVKSSQKVQRNVSFCLLDHLEALYYLFLGSNERLYYFSFVCFCSSISSRMLRTCNKQY